MNIVFFLTPKQDVAYIYEDFTLRQTLDKMENHRYSAVPIIRRTGEYVGTITEGDLLWAIKNQFSLNLKVSEDVTVGQIPRHADNRPVSVNTDIKELVDKSLEQNFVPVVDDRGVFIGIITRKKIIEYFYQILIKKENEAAN